MGCVRREVICFAFDMISMRDLRPSWPKDGLYVSVDSIRSLAKDWRVATISSAASPDAAMVKEGLGAFTLEVVNDYEEKQYLVLFGRATAAGWPVLSKRAFAFHAPITSSIGSRPEPVTIVRSSRLGSGG